MNEPLLLGLDLGTSHIKAHAFTPQGRNIASGRRATPMSHPRPGRGEMDPEQLWQVCLELLNEISGKTAKRGELAALAITSVGEGGVPLDASGRAVFPSIAWYDTRAEPQVRELDQRFGAEWVFTATGQALHPIFSLCKLLWLRQNVPAAFRSLRHWLSLDGFVAWRLTGVMAMEYSLAARTMALDVSRDRWSEAFLQEIGISGSLFPDLVAGGQTVGTIRPAMARAAGLPPDLPVVAGGHDHVVAALALGVNDPATALDSMGSAEGLFLPLDRPAKNPQVGTHGISQGRHVAGGFYLMAGLYTSGVVVDWFLANLAPGKSYEEMMTAARQSPAGAGGLLFLPHLRLANPGYPGSRSRGSLTGLSFDTTQADMFRATLEGLAMEARYSLDEALRLSDSPAPERIVLTGGGTRNNLWLEIKAAVLNRPIHIAGEQEATALGAALLAGVGSGLFPSPQAAAQAVPLQAETLLPDPSSTEAYSRLYQEGYRELWKAVHPLHEQLGNLQD